MCRSADEPADGRDDLVAAAGSSRIACSRAALGQDDLGLHEPPARLPVFAVAEADQRRFRSVESDVIQRPDCDILPLLKVETVDACETRVDGPFRPLLAFHES